MMITDKILCKWQNLNPALLLQTSNLRLDIFPDAYAKEEIIVEQKTLIVFIKIQGKNTF